MLRRTTALVLMLVTVASTLEVGAGLAMEGALHHESAARAVAHAEASAGPDEDHGHEDAQAKTDEGRDDSRDSRHGHGTGLDHCTHVHGMAVPAHPDLTPSTSFVHAEQSEPTYHTTRVSTDLFHPPRA
jgi:hypothetical protein